MAKTSKSIYTNINLFWITILRESSFQSILYTRTKHFTELLALTISANLCLYMFIVVLVRVFSIDWFFQESNRNFTRFYNRKLPFLGNFVFENLKQSLPFISINSFVYFHEIKWLDWQMWTLSDWLCLGSNVNQ